MKLDLKLGVVIAITLLATQIALTTPASARRAGAQLPDLVPMQPYGIGLNIPDDGTSTRPLALRFTVAVANRGAYAFEVLGMPENDIQHAKAYECVGWTQRACSSRELVGEFEWNLLHEHFHFSDFARYELRHVANGDEFKPDMSDAGLLAVQPKVSFCLEDSQYDLTWSGLDQGAQGIPMYETCGQVIQGISAGWQDVYTSSLAGQQLPLDGVPDGTYAVVVKINPSGTFSEANTTNNMAYSIIVISGNGTKVNQIG